MRSESVHAFIARWSKATDSERANSQLFLSELCDLLTVPHPDATPENGYCFEFGVAQHHPDGTANVVARNVCVGKWLKVYWLATPGMIQVENNLTNATSSFVTLPGDDSKALDFALRRLATGV